MATQITASLPTLNFPKEVDYPTQEDWAAFSAAAELNFGILGGSWSAQMQNWKDQANAMSIEFNTNATIAQGLADYQGDWTSKGYTLGQTVSVSGVYYICKLTHATGQNPTTVGSIYWNLALGNWNLKVNNYGNETIAGVKTFSSTISGNINGSATSATTLTSRGGFPTGDGQDFNTLTTTGVYFVQTENFSGTLNSPGPYGTLFVQSTPPFVSQVYIHTSTGTSKTRANYDSNWSPWVENVSLTENQTIAGIKTFSSSPIVPTPTTGAQAVNKTYADLKVALAEFTGANQSLSGSGYQKLPGGLIIQWGQSEMISDTTAPITFPIAFPGGVLNYSATLGSSLDGIYSHSIGIGPTAIPKTTASVTITSTGASLLTGFSWLAFGY